jgi:hypothetical protein
MEDDSSHNVDNHSVVLDVYSQQDNIVWGQCQATNIGTAFYGKGSNRMGLQVKDLDPVGNRGEENIATGCVHEVGPSSLTIRPVCICCGGVAVIRTTQSLKLVVKLHFGKREHIVVGFAFYVCFVRGCGVVVDRRGEKKQKIPRLLDVA